MEGQLFPNQLCHGYQKYICPKEIADIQAEYFSNKRYKIMYDLTTSRQDPLRLLKHALDKWGPFKDSWVQFKLKETNQSEVLKLFKNLKNNTSLTHDNIDVLALKPIAESIVAPVTHIINLSIRHKIFPNKWKLAKRQRSAIHPSRILPPSCHPSNPIKKKHRMCCSATNHGFHEIHRPVEWQPTCLSEWTQYYYSSSSTLKYHLWRDWKQPHHNSLSLWIKRLHLTV